MDSQSQERPAVAMDQTESVDIMLPHEIVAYRIAQRAMADLKTAVYLMLATGFPDGYTNAEIGKKLGIYAGHVGNEGHISRTILGLLESESVAKQSPDSKKWSIK